MSDIERGRKEEGRGVNMDPTNRGKYQTQGLSFYIKEKNEKRKSIRVGSEWEVFHGNWQYCHCKTLTLILLFCEGDVGGQEGLH